METCECSHCSPCCTSYTLATALLRIFKPKAELSLLASGNAGTTDVDSGCFPIGGPVPSVSRPFAVSPRPPFVVNISPLCTHLLTQIPALCLLCDLRGMVLSLFPHLVYLCRESGYPAYPWGCVGVHIMRGVETTGIDLLLLKRFSHGLLSTPASFLF